MKRIAGVDIGNSTTEACILSLAESGRLCFLSSSSAPTTGTKGTCQNITGAINALKAACHTAAIDVSELDIIRLNEMAPVIGDTAMETITETVVTGSTMLGHNPDTPAGVGAAVGELISIGEIWSKNGFCEQGKKYIVAADNRFGFEQIADIVNSSEIEVLGMILQSDEAVLVWNRLNRKIPIVDEVKALEKIETGVMCAIEVAPMGESVKMLSNPYGIATLLSLDASETKAVMPIAKSLVGKRSAVVIKVPFENITENVLPAGEIYIKTEKEIYAVDVDSGAEGIMSAVQRAYDGGNIDEIYGLSGTNIGNMFKRITDTMGELTGLTGNQIKIKDLLAVDTLKPVKISGALLGETTFEKAVGIAAMVKTEKLSMDSIAERLSHETGLFVKVAGVEAVMAALGALTTPGTRLPLAILDLGGGSTDAALIDESGLVKSVHFAGAGELVTLLIQTELGISDKHTAEQIKKYPLAKVESLYHIRLESGEMRFFNEPVDAKLFGNVVLLDNMKMTKINEGLPMERIAQARREAKSKVFVTNAVRALKNIADGGSIEDIPNVVLVGGSAEDFEIPSLLMNALSELGIVCGRGNIRKTEGARNAVATGLCLSYFAE